MANSLNASTRLSGAAPAPAAPTTDWIFRIWSIMCVVIGALRVFQGHPWAGGLVLIHAATSWPQFTRAARAGGWLIWARTVTLGSFVMAVSALCVALLFDSLPTVPLPSTSAGSATRSAPGASAVSNTVAPIDKGVYEPYERATDRELFARWGRAGVAQIDHLRIAAAEQVARSPSCNRVEQSEVDDKLSAKHSTPTVFVDCSNGQRFYFTKADLGHEVVSETEKGAALGQAGAINLCTEAVRGRLNIPGSMSRNDFSTAAFQAETTGRWVVDFDFSARNGLGLRLPASAECLIGTDGTPEVHIGLK